MGNKARTQKVKGLHALYGGGFYNTTIPSKIIQSPDESLAGISYPKMARPCPLTPRHGFVDSRVVKGEDELRKVVEETFAADPEGEVMLVDFLSPTFNMIWIPSLLTIGKGHDGATAGKNVVILPLCGQNPLDPSILTNAGIKEGDWPYIEAVDTPLSYNGRIMLTQLRAGPPITSSSPDFIPSPLKVEKVIRPEGMDLLQWEKLMDEQKGVEGVVVVNVGGSPADHYSIHARESGIPTITSREVSVGEELAPISHIPPSIKSVIEGLVIGESIPLDRKKGSNAVAALLLALHGSSNMGGENGKWIGIGVALLLRLGSVALKGEARHINRAKKGGNGAMPSRETVYDQALPFTLRRHRASIPRLVHVLRYGQFGGGGVGGRKWAQCGLALAKLFNAVGRLVKEESPEALSLLIKQFNITVNQAHNGGWWLNKFASSGLFDQIKDGDIMPTLTASPFIYEAGTTEVSPTVVERKVERWKGWRPIVLNSPPPKTVEMACIPGLGGVTFKVSDRILKGDLHREIILPAETILDFFVNNVRGNIYLDRDKDGVKIFIKRPHMEKEKVWEEETLSEQGVK